VKDLLKVYTTEKEFENMKDSGVCRVKSFQVSCTGSSEQRYLKAYPLEELECRVLFSHRFRENIHKADIGSENRSQFHIMIDDSPVFLLSEIVGKEEIDQLFQDVPKLERLFRIITQRTLSVLQKRFFLTVSANAEERYEELIQRHAGIEQLVPQHQIASYLGILPESLSRMKKQLMERKMKK
jgi:hypothetical protein